MIYYHDFQINLLRSLGKKNLFPNLDYCPNCRAKNGLLRHGFYERNAIEDDMIVRIPICRLLCPDCGKTIFLFCRCFFRQLRGFMRNGRTVSNGNRTVLLGSGRTSAGERALLPREPKEKAIKMLQMIQAFGKATYIKGWWHHRVNSFMAAPFYHGSENRITFPHPYFLVPVPFDRL
ncbi:hypothetical protein DFP97_10267 [Paenibacillus prosopidis]|uniref:Uncharacterized protein n=1 Tax=Paenibacillus prosopidis TaxID=630520 RepID=A0A368W545_9BACL|nr:hypothetical protein DFP97_10267 [Paenibacillus prosopidis]